MYNIVLKKSAQKQLTSLPKEARLYIAKKIDEIQAQGPRTNTVKKLHDPLQGYTKRVGKYRILFDIQDKDVLIYRISKRSDVYR